MIDRETLMSASKSLSKDPVKPLADSNVPIILRSN